MINELGHFALVLAFAVSIAQSIIPLWGAHKGYAEPMRFAQPAAITAFLLVGLAFAALTYAFVNSDFSLRIVAANSHSLKPMLYKISGVWGNHEGSMLLWVLILTLFGGLVAALGSAIPSELKARTLVRFESPPPGPRSRLPSALPLHGICRPLDAVQFRRCCPH